MCNISNNEKYMIINADDYGMCHSANEAIMQMFEDKIITSASLMPVCPWYEEAKVFAVKTNADIGAHITLTSEWNDYRWSCLTNRKSLLDENGYHMAAIEQIKRRKYQSYTYRYSHG